MLQEDVAGELQVELRECCGFKQDQRPMAVWVGSFHPEELVMESTGIDWKSPYAALERFATWALVVNARHVKQVPGPKSDISAARWLACLPAAACCEVAFFPG